MKHRTMLLVLGIAGLIVALASVIGNLISDLIDMALASGSGLWIASIAFLGLSVLGIGYLARAGIRKVDDDFLDHDARRRAERNR